MAALQQFLVEEACLPSTAVTGTFDGPTRAALSHWQAAMGVPATGYFGDASRLAYLQGQVCTQRPDVLMESRLFRSVVWVVAVPCTRACPGSPAHGCCQGDTSNQDEKLACTQGDPCLNMQHGRHWQHEEGAGS